MKKLAIIFGLTILVTACNLFENKEKKAIEICQKAKVEFATDNTTWLDYANMQAKMNANKKYDWKAEITNETNIYLVAFVDQDNWGDRWEVDIEQQIVKFVNQNEYLSRKYGLSRFDQDGNFQITNITIDTLKLEKANSYSSEKTSNEIIYALKASVVNKTKKTLTSANISGQLQVIYKDKTVEGNSNLDNSFPSISKSAPWYPDTEKDFYIKTQGIEEIYLNYEPEYVFFEVYLSAEDPVGFSYNKGIAEYDLKTKWKNLKHNLSSARPASSATVNSAGSNMAFVDLDKIKKRFNYSKHLFDSANVKFKIHDDLFNQRASALQKKIDYFKKEASNMTIGQARTMEEELASEQEQLVSLQHDFQNQEASALKEIESKVSRLITPDLKDYGKTNNLQILVIDKNNRKAFSAINATDVTEEIIILLNNRYKNKR